MRRPHGNTRRVYRAGVRAWCDGHGVPCLPASSIDILTFLTAKRGRRMNVITIALRRTAIRYPHYIARLGVPTADAPFEETMACIHCQAADAGELAAKRVAASAGLLRQIWRRPPTTCLVCAAVCFY